MHHLGIRNVNAVTVVRGKTKMSTHKYIQVVWRCNSKNRCSEFFYKVEKQKSNEYKNKE